MSGVTFGAAPADQQPVSAFNLGTTPVKESRRGFRKATARHTTTPAQTGATTLPWFLAVPQAGITKATASQPLQGAASFNCQAASASPTPPPKATPNDWTAARPPQQPSAAAPPCGGDAVFAFGQHPSTSAAAGEHTPKVKLRTSRRTRGLTPLRPSMHPWSPTLGAAAPEVTFGSPFSVMNPQRPAAAEGTSSGSSAAGAQGGPPAAQETKEHGHFQAWPQQQAAPKVIPQRQPQAASHVPPGTPPPRWPPASAPPSVPPKTPTFAVGAVGNAPTPGSTRRRGQRTRQASASQHASTGAVPLPMSTPVPTAPPPAATTSTPTLAYSPMAWSPFASTPGPPPSTPAPFPAAAAAAATAHMSGQGGEQGCPAPEPVQPVFGQGRKVFPAAVQEAATAMPAAVPAPASGMGVAQGSLPPAPNTFQSSATMASHIQEALREQAERFARLDIKARAADTKQPGTATATMDTSGRDAPSQKGAAQGVQHNNGSGGSSGSDDCAQQKDVLSKRTAWHAAFSMDGCQPPATGAASQPFAAAAVAATAAMPLRGQPTSAPAPTQPPCQSSFGFVPAAPTPAAPAPALSFSTETSKVPQPMFQAPPPAPPPLTAAAVAAFQAHCHNAGSGSLAAGTAGCAGIPAEPVFNLGASAIDQGTPSRRARLRARHPPRPTAAPAPQQQQPARAGAAAGAVTAAAMAEKQQPRHCSNTAAPQHGTSVPMVPLGPPPAVDPVAQARTDTASFKLKGNNAYNKQDWLQAEHWWTLAINRLKPLAWADGVSSDLAVLYSNRAGTRIMVGKPQAALGDCQKATALDPKYFKAISRAATVLCRLGDFTAARLALDGALDRLSASSLHFPELYKKLAEVKQLEAAVAELTTQLCSGTGSCGQRAASLGREALEKVVADVQVAYAQSPYSEVVYQIRAVVHLALGHTSEVAAACEPHEEARGVLTGSPWRLWATAQARYLIADLQGAAHHLQLLTRALATAPAAKEDDGKPTVVSVPPLAGAEAALAHVQMVLRLKEEGNAAVKSGRHEKAAELYGAALAAGCGTAGAAVLFCNRAATHQAMGNLADALADCARARALDPTYARAHTRLAGLLLEVRCSEVAATGLSEFLKSDAASSLPASERSSIASRASQAKETAAWQKTADHYKLLAVARTATDEDVRKSYRKMALKFHPDKALAGCKVSAALLAAAGPAPAAAMLAPHATALVGATEAEQRVRAECTWLFSLISTAHEELSDKARRRKVDQLLAAEREPLGQSYAAKYGGYTSNPHSTYTSFSSGSSYGGAAYSRPQPQQPQQSRPSAAAAAAAAAAARERERQQKQHQWRTGGAGGASAGAGTHWWSERDAGSAFNEEDEEDADSYYGY